MGHIFLFWTAEGKKSEANQYKEILYNTHTGTDYEDV